MHLLNTKWKTNKPHTGNIKSRAIPNVNYSLLVLIIFGELCHGDQLPNDETHQYLLQERKRLAKLWAPKVWLHSQELHFPSDIEYFLKNIKVSDYYGEYITHNISGGVYLPVGENTSQLYLNAPIDVDCRNCPMPPFLYGLKPTSQYTPPVYATIHSCISENPTEIEEEQQLETNEIFKRETEQHISQPVHNSYTFSTQDYAKEDNLHSTITQDEIIENTYKTNKQDESKDNKNVYIIGTQNNGLGNKNLVTPTMQGNVNELEDSSILNAQEYANRNKKLYTLSIQKNISETKNVLVNSNAYLTKVDLKRNNGQSHTDPKIYKNEYTTTTPLNRTTLGKQEFAKQTATTKPASFKPNPINTVPDIKKTIYSQNFTVTYWMFYPFNQGKTICSTRLWGIGRIPKMLENGSCNWDTITMGNHVGDWEHVSIYFTDNMPTHMYVSTHYFGAFYNYNATENKFNYYGQDARVGPLLYVNYPKEVIVEGTQPILYSAYGSHGLWAQKGNLIYNERIVVLSDDTDEGVMWDTKKNIQVLDRKDMEQMYRKDRQWLRYKGRWGNPSHNCHIGLLGFCELTKGPQGIPMKRVNFPCHDLNHSTFHPVP